MSEIKKLMTKKEYDKLVKIRWNLPSKQLVAFNKIGARMERELKQGERNVHAMAYIMKAALQEIGIDV